MKKGVLIAIAVWAASFPFSTAYAKTCSQLIAECVAWNKSHGSDVGRCEGYRASCMATGTYQDRNRTITNVTRK